MPKILKRKWRPKLWHVVFLVLGLVLCLPFAGLILFQFYANQLVQQTEESLIGQASVLAATYAELYKETGHANSVGLVPAPETEIDGYEGYTPVFPTLSFSRDTVLPPRPSAVSITTQAQPHYVEIGNILTNIANAAQQQTLAGYRILDNIGNVIGGSAEVGTSLVAVKEVSLALQGRFSSVARERIRDTREPLVYSLSSGTKVRVFVALPVVVDEYVVGAIYLNRTPNHIFRFLYGERHNLIKATLFVLLATSLIGLVFWRFITRPIHALIQRTKHIEQNGKSNREPLEHYGTREVENLSHSFESMTTSLQKRQDAINNYTSHVTHELKSPLTSVQGAAELLRDAGAEMTDEQQKAFLSNIVTDTIRMEDLLKTMREFAQADQPMPTGTCSLDQIEDKLRSQFNSLSIRLVNKNMVLPVHQKTLKILLKHLLENAQEHGSQNVTLTAGKDGQTYLDISDDGTGISAGNREKVMTPFFTTRRESGGTGMGLNIVKSMLEAQGGHIEVTDQKNGAEFRIRLGDIAKGF